jgi:hypothetical protein
MIYIDAELTFLAVSKRGGYRESKLFEGLLGALFEISLSSASLNIFQEHERATPSLSHIALSANVVDLYLNEYLMNISIRKKI